VIGQAALPVRALVASGWGFTSRTLAAARAAAQSSSTHDVSAAAGRGTIDHAARVGRGLRAAPCAASARRRTAARRPRSEEGRVARRASTVVTVRVRLRSVLARRRSTISGRKKKKRSRCPQGLHRCVGSSPAPIRPCPSTVDDSGRRKKTRSRCPQGLHRCVGSSPAPIRPCPPTVDDSGPKKRSRCPQGLHRCVGSSPAPIRRSPSAVDDSGPKKRSRCPQGLHRCGGAKPAPSRRSPLPRDGLRGGLGDMLSPKPSTRDTGFPSEKNLTVALPPGPGSIGGREPERGLRRRRGELASTPWVRARESSRAYTL